MKNFIYNSKEIIKKFLRSIKFEGQYRIQRNSQIFGDPNKNTFFGYYDKSPFNYNKNIILAHVHSEKIKPVSKASDIEVGFFELGTGNYKKIGETNAWCWQMGSRLMWLPNNSDMCIYNVSNNDGYRSVVVNINNSRIETMYKLPIFDLSSDGKTAVSLNFSKLHNVRPGYGYVNFQDKYKNIISPKDDGIWLLNMETEHYELILSLNQINDFLSITNNTKRCIDYVNHLRFSPGNNRLYFYYVWKYGKNNLDRKIFPLVYDLISKELNLITKENISHECWKDDDNLMLWSNDSKCYNLYNFEEDSVIPYYKELLQEDGHPSFIGEDEFLTDTYPDKMGYQYLLHLKDKKEVLGKFHVPYKLNGEIRCDLHPRFSLNKKKIAVDIFHNHSRKICVIDLYE